MDLQNNFATVREQSPENENFLNKKLENSNSFKSKRRVRYLPQQRSVFDMSVYDNILV